MKKNKDMKKTLKLSASALCMALLLMSAKGDEGIMEKEKGTYVVNTTRLASDVRGFQGATPVKIYIKGNKIQSIEALSNDETPKHWAKVKKLLLEKWNGLTVDKALKTEVDVVTGATLSSKAVKENVKRGLEYYKKNK